MIHFLLFFYHPNLYDAQRMNYDINVKKFDLAEYIKFLRFLMQCALKCILRCLSVRRNPLNVGSV
jgi:hypothetical protein